MSWKPENGDPYCYLGVFGHIEYSVWTNNEIDNYLWSTGNVYRTEKSAIFDNKKRVVKEKLEMYANESQRKELSRKGYRSSFRYFLNYSEKYKLLYADCCVSENRIESVSYFCSKEEAMDAVEKIGKDKIKKYLFEVEEYI